MLLTRATDSVLLSIEHFNRPWDRGRIDAVLILLDRAFELLLKAVIVHKGGKIREPRAKETIGFATCVRKCVSDSKLKCLTEEEALTIQIINSLRDAAQHYLLDVSEQQLYIYAQSGLTLFDKLLNAVFSAKLSDYLPERVLPLTASPPMDFGTLLNLEFAEIRKLVAPGSRKMMRARAKLRAFAIIEESLGGSRLQPGEARLAKLASRIAAGTSWTDVFPGIRQLNVVTEGAGPTVKLRITKSGAGEPITLVPEGTPGATVVAIKRVDELGFYSLSLRDLAPKCGLSEKKTLAVIHDLNLQADGDCFKEIAIGKSRFKRYSPTALDRIKKALPNLDIAEIWKRHSATLGGRRRPAGPRANAVALQRFGP